MAGRIPNSVKSLCSVEKIKVKSWTTDKKNKLIEVVAEDGREYFVFEKKEFAFNYAVKVFVDTTDDPAYLSQISFLNKTVKQYAEDLVAKKDVPSVISYDQYHKARLANDALAYRTI